MSYILDALRKSDQQRQRGAAPTLLTTQATAGAPKPPAVLLYGLLAAVLVIAGVVIGWLRPWQPEQPPSATQPLAAKPFEPGQRPTVPTSPALLPEMASKSGQEQSVRKPTSAAQHAAEPASAATRQQMPALATAETQNTPRKAATAVAKDARMSTPEKPAGTGLEAAPQEQKVMTVAELPASIRQEIPRMTISVHAYSPRPADRIVGINDQLLREGGYVAPGLMLEQITPDGMIFSYKGYRFRHGLQGAAATAETQ
jgi:general secretion pathway protein B